jgi:formamidopyrimidine-DNA glycosylase
MPEGPEVRVIVDQLSKQIKGKAIEKIEIVSGRYTRHGPPPGFDKLPMPIIVNEVSSKGKFIFFELSDGWHIFNSLGMSGTWGVFPVTHKIKHARMRFHFRDGGVLTFIDPRNFGTVKFVHGRTLLTEKLQTLGWDPLRDDLIFDDVLKKVRMKPTRNVTKILMDQTLFAGVGNYIKAEALYRAQISPHRTVCEIDDLEWENLCDQISIIMQESLEARGTTIRDYRDTNGDAGKFQNLLRVYGKKKDPIGNEVVKEKTPDKRTTHWVPTIQK